MSRRPTCRWNWGVYDDVSVYRVVAEGSYAYIIEGVANQLDWLHILDISDPASPSLTGSLVMPYITWNLFLSDNYLYVAGRDDGLRIVDVSDPSNPAEVGSYPLPRVVETLVVGNLLYVTAFEAPGGGFFIFSLDDPENPVLLGHYEAPGFVPWHFDVSGDYAYVNHFDDIHLLLIADPGNPQDLDEYTMPGDIYNVLARDEFIYVSNGAAGLQILENLLFEDPSDIVGQEQSSGRPQLRLASVPNPFNSQTTIRFAVPGAAEVDLEVVDVAGRHVRSLLSGLTSPGERTIRWDGRDDGGRLLGSGTYIIRLKVGDLVQGRKVSLLR
jgi:hypothetical protein